MNKLEEVLGNVKSKDDFIIFLELLKNDFNENQERWENITVEDYLNAILRWSESMEQCYINTNRQLPKNINWNFIASLFHVGKIYE